MRGPPRPRADRDRPGRRRAWLLSAGAVARHAFGIAIEERDDLLADVGSGTGGAREPATVVELVAGGLLDDWPESEAHLVREVRAGGVLAFSVRHAPGSGYLLSMPGVGLYLIAEDGRRIRCEAPDRSACRFGLIAQALPLAATLRGLEPFHACGLAIGAGALTIAGPVGAGKSSLAAALVEGGALLLSDDVVAVDDHAGELRAHPGSRRLRLRPAEAARACATRLTLVAEQAGRSEFDAPLVDGPLPLRAMYFLAAQPEPAAIAALPASGVTLLAATYNLSVRAPSRLARQLALVERLAAAVPLLRVTVSPQVDAPELAAQLREHFEAIAP